jgi:hypothetical protein
MTRLLAVALAAAVLGAGALAADAGGASTTGLPACALGRLPAVLRTIVPEAIGRAQRRFGALGLTGAGHHRRSGGWVER